MRSNRLVATLAILLVIGIAGVAQASGGGPLLLGQENTVQSETVLRDTGQGNQAALTVDEGDGDIAVRAVCHTNDCWGVRAIAEGQGVSGEGQGPGSIGVMAEGYVGLLTSGSWAAIEAYGPTFFNRSGVVVIPAGAVSATVTLTALEGRLRSSSLVFATLQMRPGAGVFVRAAVPKVSTNSFTVYLNKAVAGSLKVAWFIVN